MMRNSVVLPHPDGPTSAPTPPAGSVKARSRNTTRRPPEAGEQTEEILAEYPIVTEAGIRAAAAYGAALAHEELLPLPHAQ